MKYQVLTKFHTTSDSQLLDILFRMAEKHPESFEEFLLENDLTEMVVPFAGGRVAFTRAQMTELRGMSTPDRKVNVIKRIREITGIGLKEAKDLCEAEFIKPTAW